MAVRSLKLLGGGIAVRGSEGHPADADDLASEKGHLLAKRALFSTITGGQLVGYRYTYSSLKRWVGLLLDGHLYSY